MSLICIPSPNPPRHHLSGRARPLVIYLKAPKGGNRLDVKLGKQAEKYFHSQDRVTRQRLKKGLSGLEKEPPEGDIVPIQGVPNTFRLRIGDFRVLFREDADAIIVTKIHPRGQVYK